MPNEEQLKILTEEGVSAWIKWRQKKPPLVKIDLSEADLTGVDLYRANLSEVDLTGADLTEADLTRVNLTRANLTRANLTRANLTRAQLYRANFSEANLTRANLKEANLKGANLTRADLYKTNLEQADLYKSNLEAAELTRANLKGANLKGANLTQADLHQTNLDQAILTDTQALQTPCSKTNLNGVGLPNSQINPPTELNHLVGEYIYLTGEGNQQTPQDPWSEPINLAQVRAQTRAAEESQKERAREEVKSVGVGAWALGELKEIVDKTIEKLPSSSHLAQPGIKKLLTQIQETIEGPNLSEHKQKLALEQLQVIAEAGMAPKEKTMQEKAEIAVGFLEVIATGVEPSTKLAQACARLLPKILAFFWYQRIHEDG